MPGAVANRPRVLVRWFDVISSRTLTYLSVDCGTLKLFKSWFNGGAGGKKDVNVLMI